MRELAGCAGCATGHKRPADDWWAGYRADCGARTESAIALPNNARGRLTRELRDRIGGVGHGMRAVAGRQDAHLVEKRDREGHERHPALRGNRERRPYACRRSATDRQLRRRVAALGDGRRELRSSGRIAHRCRRNERRRHCDAKSVRRQAYRTRNRAPRRMGAPDCRTAAVARSASESPHRGIRRDRSLYTHMCEAEGRHSLDSKNAERIPGDEFEEQSKDSALFTC